MRIFFDMTLSYRRCGKQPGGILRVERNLVRSLLGTADVPVRFCRIDRRNGRLVAITRRRAAFVASSADNGARADVVGKKPKRSGRLANLIKRAFSRWLRWDPLQHVPLLRHVHSDLFAALGDHDVYVLVGMPWDSHDLELVEAVKARQRFKLFVLVHDIMPLLVPQHFEDEMLPDRYRSFIETTLGAADGIACVSRSTRDDLVHYAKSKKTKLPDTRLVPLGSEIDENLTSNLEKLPGIDGTSGFVLAVTGLDPRKNVGLLYQVWGRLAERQPGPIPRLLVCGEFHRNGKDLQDRILNDPRTRDTIVLLGKVSDRVLMWLYRNCLFTAFPSFYEGWGLPVVESLLHGKFCIASSTSSLPEAGQGLVKHLDPLDFAAWYKEIARLVTEPARLVPLEAKIRENYKAVTWRETRDALLAQIAALTAGADQGSRR